MVARPGTYQASNNAGELKPEEHGRTDLKQFYAGLALALNIEPVPQGGSRLSPRTRHLGRVRRALADVAPASTSQNLGPHAVVATLAALTFTSAQAVSVVAVAGFGASQPLGAIVRVEWTADGVTYQPFGAPFKAGLAPVTLAVALPPGSSVNAVGLRVRMFSAPPSSTTFALDSVTAQTETSTIITAARIRPFTFSLDQAYVAVISDRHIDFFRDGSYVGCAKTSFAAARVEALGVQQRFDTMLLFHDEVRSERIRRNGSDSEWIVDQVPYSAVPRVDLGGAYTNQVTDIWKVYLSYPTSGSYANGVNLFVSVNISGEETAGVPTGATVDWPAFAAATKAAIEALPSIAAGITVTEDHSTGGLTVLTIAFTGAGNNGVRNTMSAQVVNTSAAAATVTHAQLGVPGGEDLMSVSAGWPACALFYQDRLVTGGFRSKRSALLASVTGEYFDTNVEIISPSGAILANLDTDGAERLHHFARARHLVLFTTDAEYFISDRALSRTTVPTIVNCSRNGSAPTIPIVESEDALIYVNYHRTILYAAAYDDVSQAYVSQPLSLLASHIASDQIDMALQKPASATDAGRLWQVRADGTMCLGIMLRNQEVTAFVRWQTAGAVRSVCVDGKNVPHLLVQRTVGGVDELHVERLELGLLFDGTVEQTFEAPVAVVPNLGVHEGAAVWALADGYVAGPFTVAGGEIALPTPAQHVLVGRWTAPRGIPLPLPSEVAERIVLKRPKRVHTVRVDLIDTTSIAIGANGRPPKDIALYRAGDPTDAPLAPVTREIVVTGLAGYSQEGQIEITQLKPGKLAWSSFTREART